MIGIISLHRIRLELDRQLRAHAFFARALRGDLGSLPYADFLVEMSALVGAIDHDQGIEFESLASIDLRRLGAPSNRGECTAARHLNALGRSYDGCLARQDIVDLTLAMFGSSWTRDACEPLARSHPDAVGFLSELGRQGPLRFAAVKARIEQGCLEVRHAFTYAEVARGALLGVASYLDSIWPAPVVVGAFEIN